MAIFIEFDLKSAFLVKYRLRNVVVVCVPICRNTPHGPNLLMFFRSLIAAPSGEMSKVDCSNLICAYYPINVSQGGRFEQLCGHWANILRSHHAKAYRHAHSVNGFAVLQSLTLLAAPYGVTVVARDDDAGSMIGSEE